MLCTIVAVDRNDGLLLGISTVASVAALVALAYYARRVLHTMVQQYEDSDEEQSDSEVEEDDQHSVDPQGTPSTAAASHADPTVEMAGGMSPRHMTSPLDPAPQLPQPHVPVSSNDADMRLVESSDSSRVVESTVQQSNTSDH